MKNLIRNDIDYYFILAVALTAPMTFLTLRPIVNVFFADVIIVGYIFYFFCTGYRRSFDRLTLYSVLLILLGYVLSNTLSPHKDGFYIPLSQYGVVFIFILTLSGTKLNYFQIQKVFYFYLIGISSSIIVSMMAFNSIIIFPNLDYFVAGRFNGVWGNPNGMAKEMISCIIFLIGSITFLDNKNKNVLFSSFVK